MKEKIVHVAAAVIIRNGLVLASSRPADKPHAGKWEFPGGKCEKGETLQETLQREMLEELEFPVSVGSELCRIKPAENLEIVFFLCSALTEKEPAAKENQQWCWADSQKLQELDFLPADVPVAEKIVHLLKNLAL